MNGARRATVVVVALGLLAAAGVALSAGSSGRDTVAVVGLATLGASVAAVTGAVVAHVVRRRRLGVQVTVIGMTVIATTAAGALVSAKAMFIASHDLVVLACVLLASASVAAGAGLRFSGVIERQLGDVVGLARGLADPSVASRAPSSDLSAEFRLLSDELHDASTALEASRSRERALDASRRELVAWVSHDLRSPIASIRAVAEALEDGVVDDAESIARYHRIVRQEAERLGVLVDDLFELSRITAGALTASDDLLPLLELVAEVVDGAASVAEARGVEIRTELDGATAALVPAAHFGRALRNVVDNAVRHTAPGGTLTVSAQCGQGVVTLHVDDECGGIPAHDIDRVFDVAFRGDAARGRDSGGGGLGLAIAQGLMQLHRGTIGVANRGRGCRFTLRLPDVS